MTKLLPLFVAALSLYAPARARADAQGEAEAALHGHADAVIDGSARGSEAPVVFERNGGPREPELSPADEADRKAEKETPAPAAGEKPPKDYTNLIVAGLGAMAGAAIGFAFGPWGILIGALVGAVVGYAASWAARKYLIKK